MWLWRVLFEWWGQWGHPLGPSVNREKIIAPNFFELGFGARAEVSFGSPIRTCSFVF